MKDNKNNGKNGLLARCELIERRFLFIAAFLFLVSGVVNVLALTGSFYMMQIYDRALASASIPTLVAISVIAIFLYLFQGMLDIIRSQILNRLGARMDRKVAPEIHDIVVDMPRFGFSASEACERGRDLDTVRGFLGSQGPIALLDLPWVPVFVIFVYLLHPFLGALTLGGAVVLSTLAIITESLTRRLTAQAHGAAIERNAVAESHARNADIIKAMGFSSAVVARFVTANEKHLKLQARASDITGSLSAFSKVLRMILQSSVLGMGAYLTIQGELSAGAIIACSVASARALAPIDMAIGNWKNVLQARSSWDRLHETLEASVKRQEPVALPLPSKSLSVENVTVAEPATGRVIVADIAFKVTAGQALGIIGPSGGGKTTLIKAMSGVWPPLRGHVRLDGADLTQWQESMIAASIGYLPQDYGLFEDTIERNISRLETPDPQKVVKAAQAAGVHELILSMADGYQTKLGPYGGSLSAGQRQRLALARALYGEPFLLLLDEPNSNLDSEGEKAVGAAIEGVKARGGIVVVVAHRPSALVGVDQVAVLQNGQLAAFGPKDEILRAKPVNEARTGQSEGAKKLAAVGQPA